MPSDRLTARRRELQRQAAALRGYGKAKAAGEILHADA